MDGVVGEKKGEGSVRNEKIGGKSKSTFEPMRMRGKL